MSALGLCNTYHTKVLVHSWVPHRQQHNTQQNMSVPAWGKPLFYGDISGTGSAGGTLDTGAVPDLGRQPERLGRNRGITYSTTHFLFLKIYKNTCIYLYNPRFFVAHLPQAHYQLSLFKITLFYTNRPL